ncbi:MAG: glycosyltransferase family 39 protein [Microcystaceae cyanobacterium]
MLKASLAKRMSEKVSTQFSTIWLFFWILLGTILRFTNLTAKPPWTDEFATMVFSLGNRFEGIPLNQVISGETFLTPLIINSQTTITDVINLILDKDNHPPLYFVLSHLWTKLFSSQGEMVSLWGMRSLSVIFGIVSIPLVYWVGKKILKSSMIGHFSAAIIAVSPYGVFIAQEARHYTLAILFVIASIGCFIQAFEKLTNREFLSYQLIFIWIIVNSLGLSVHYFLGLVIIAEALSLMLLFLLKLRGKRVYFKPWLSLIWVALGTATSGLIWVYLSLSKGYGNEMIAWIQRHDYPILGLINPPFQLLSAWITMFTLLPVEADSLGIIILSGLGMLIFFLWFIPIFYKAVKLSLKNDKTQPLTQALLLLISSLLIITFTVTYGFGIDITRGARYSFIYFPPIILITGIALATIWQNIYFDTTQLISPKLFTYLSNLIPSQSKLTVIIIWFMGFIGAITVLVNLGYQKYYNPTHLVKVIKETSAVSTLVVAPYISLSQTGEIMGIAWESVQQNVENSPNFIILKQDNTDVYQLPHNLQKENNPTLYPLDIWSVNFYYSSLNLDTNCQLDSQKFPAINGYNYRRFQCN